MQTTRTPKVSLLVGLKTDVLPAKSIKAGLEWSVADDAGAPGQSEEAAACHLAWVVAQLVAVVPSFGGASCVSSSRLVAREKLRQMTRRVILSAVASFIQATRHLLGSPLRGVVDHPRPGVNAGYAGSHEGFVCPTAIFKVGSVVGASGPRARPVSGEGVKRPR